MAYKKTKVKLSRAMEYFYNNNIWTEYQHPTNIANPYVILAFPFRYF